MTDSNGINLDLADQVVDRIPPGTWLNVREAIIASLVDYMPSTVTERLTGDPTNFERAEEILSSYYAEDERNLNLIRDAFQILGEETTLYLLDSLQLDKIKDCIKAYDSIDED
jgi:hypothetical protein